MNSVDVSVPELEEKHALIKNTEQIIFMMTATTNCQLKKICKHRFSFTFGKS